MSLPSFATRHAFCRCEGSGAQFWDLEPDRLHPQDLRNSLAATPTLGGQAAFEAHPDLRYALDGSRPDFETQ